MNEIKEEVKGDEKNEVKSAFNLFNLSPYIHNRTDWNK